MSALQAIAMGGHVAVLLLLVNSATVGAKNDKGWPAKIQTRLDAHKAAYNARNLTLIREGFTDDIRRSPPNRNTTVGINATMAVYEEELNAPYTVRINTAEFEKLNLFTSKEAIAEFTSEVEILESGNPLYRVKGVSGYREEDGEVRVYLNYYNYEP